MKPCPWADSGRPRGLDDALQNHIASGPDGQLGAVVEHDLGGAGQARADDFAEKNLIVEGDLAQLALQRSPNLMARHGDLAEAGLGQRLWRRQDKRQGQQASQRPAEKAKAIRHDHSSRPQLQTLPIVYLRLAEDLRVGQ